MKQTLVLLGRHDKLHPDLTMPVWEQQVAAVDSQLKVELGWKRV